MLTIKLLTLVSLTAILLTTVDAKQKKKKKCSKTLGRIPVHKNFNIDRFSGEWFDITRTASWTNKDEAESFTFDIGQSDDGTYRMRVTARMGDKCLPVSVLTVEETERPGHYVLKGSQDDETLIISFTDYKEMALVVYCVKHRFGKLAQCQPDGLHITIMSRSPDPKKKLVNQYIKRATKRVCGAKKDFILTKPGLCKIPDILEEAKRDHDGLAENKDAVSVGSNICAVDNVPLQKDFDLSMMDGLWYEIARTRNTFNKMESVVSKHIYDDVHNNIYSYYTGTVVNSNADDEGANATCMTAIKGMSKTKANKKKHFQSADRLGRIGWDDSTYPWSTLKVVYADGDYMLYFSCFAGNTGEPCVKQAMEVTLVGKTPNITDEKRDAIFGILPSECFNPADMKETEFLANCTSWVDVKEKEVTPEDCKLGEIPLIEGFNKRDLEGRWHLFGSINYNNMTSLSGVTMDNHIEWDVVQTVIMAFSHDPNEQGECVEFSVNSRDMCVDTSDRITTLPVGGDGNFVFSKVLYLDSGLLVEYICAKRTEDDTCLREGIQFNVYTSNDTLQYGYEDEILMETVSTLAKVVCLDPKDLHIETEWCEANHTSEADDHGMMDTSCEDIDHITIFSDFDDLHQESMYGYWYEIGRSSRSTFLTNADSTVAYITSGSNDTLNIYYTGFKALSSDEHERDTTEDGEDNAEDDDVCESCGACAEVAHTSMIGRCSTEPSGDYMARYRTTDNFVSYVPFKIVHTDYVESLVTFACSDVLPTGRCSIQGTHVRIWSRTPTLSEEGIDLARDLLSWTCVDTYEEGFMTFNQPRKTDCHSVLEEYVKENEVDVGQVEEVAQEDIDVDSTESAEEDIDQNHQNDEHAHFDFELSDIDALLDIPDDIFYADRK